MADCLRNCLNRKGDLAVRYGGEEMAAFVPCNDSAGAFALAEKIRLAVLARNIEHAGNPMGIVTISLGVYTCLPGECLSMETVVEQADTAVYSAKHQGRNKTVMQPLQST